MFPAREGSALERMVLSSQCAAWPVVLSGDPTRPGGSVPVPLGLRLQLWLRAYLGSENDSPSTIVPRRELSDRFQRARTISQ